MTSPRTGEEPAVCDNWMRPLRLPLSHADFLELPRNPAYRYQYADGVASITPMPRYYHCRLDLTRGPASDGQTRNWEGLVRPLAEGDWAKLPRLFAESFHEVEPFAGLNELGTEYAGTWPWTIHAPGTMVRSSRRPASLRRTRPALSGPH